LKCCNRAAFAVIAVIIHILLISPRYLRHCYTLGASYIASCIRLRPSWTACPPPSLSRISAHSRSRLPSAHRTLAGRRRTTPGSLPTAQPRRFEVERRLHHLNPTQPAARKATQLAAPHSCAAQPPEALERSPEKPTPFGKVYSTPMQRRLRPSCARRLRQRCPPSFASRARRTATF
jgi:hypothetical protein